MHLYFDADYSGDTDNCVSETIGVELLTPLTKWLKENNLKGTITEIGAGKS